MSKAKELIQKIQEFIPLSHYGKMTASDIEDAFKERFASFGFEVGVEATIDLDEGPLVTFIDSEGDEVTILFYICDERGPVASVVSSDDEQIEVELDSFGPPVVEMDGRSFIDLTDLSWMNKSVVLTLLQAGEVIQAEHGGMHAGDKRRKGRGGHLGDRL